MGGAAACALLVASACSSAPTRSSVPAPDDWAPAPQQAPLATGLSPTEPPEAPEESAVEVGPGSPGRGLIAAAGPTGLRLLLPSGDVVGEVAPDYVVTQPTWSRDGLRLAATLISPDSDDSLVAVVDITTGDVTTVPARRPYFFYSWNHDATRLAALGPGSRGGTALDVLDQGGVPTSETSMQSSSIYLAWEPDGRRLVIHAGPQLLLVEDPDSLDYTELGSVGFGFTAAAWVPGTQDILYVDALAPPAGDGSSEALGEEDGAEVRPWLVRRSIDSGQVVDLGPVTSLIGMAVHPDGDRVALSFATLDQTSGADPADTADSTSEVETASASLSDDDAAAQSQLPQWDGSVQMLDLATAERLTVLDLPGWWLEWSPDGRRLLMATSAPQEAGAAGEAGAVELAWHVWDDGGDGGSVELARFAPSVAFGRNYLPFADQYDETPRLWSPDSDAITFGASTSEGDVSAVARLDNVGGLTTLGPSDVSFWSPLPDSLQSP